MAGPSVLHVLIDAAHAGVLERSPGSLRFTYDDDYRRSPNATPLSCSLPLALKVHSGAKVRAFIDGLLPDSDTVRARWAAEFRTRDSAFDLLAHVGEDCAGAVQFVRPSRLGDLDPGSVEWLDDDQIAAWIDHLRVDPAGWLAEYGHGQFSLAGAQSKFALLFRDGRWGRPSGALPTTHIFKPASPQFAGHELNEHLSLELARAVGLPAAVSQVREFAGRRVVVVERYDRLETSAGLRRVHQEDLCQALGRPPGDKYEAGGGPGAADIVAKLRDLSSDPASDVAQFVDALLFNWVVANTDAHAKNYGLLLAGRAVRLAPLYDLASALPYVGRTPSLPGSRALSSDRLKLAMRVDDQYRLVEIRRRDWEDLFDRLGLDPQRWVAQAGELLDRIDASLAAVVAPVAASFDSPMPERFESCVRTAVGLRRAVLASRPVRGHRR